MTINLRAVGLSGSPRHGNTEYIIEKVLSDWKKHVKALDQNVTVEVIHVSLANKKISPCMSCQGCVRKGSICILKDDWWEIIKNLVDPVPNVLFIGTPVYFYGPSAQLRATLERCTSLFKKAYNPDHKVSIPDWTKTVAGALSVGYHRHGGQEHALMSVIHWLLICGFLVAGGMTLEKGPLGYTGAPAWEFASGSKGKQVVAKDQVGMENIDALAMRIAKASLLIAHNNPR